jgi:hypothetical protein
VWNALQPIPVRRGESVEVRVAEWFVLTGRVVEELYDGTVGLKHFGGQWIA